MPKTSKLRPEKKEEKPMGPFKRMMNGYRLCVTFTKRPDSQIFDTQETWYKLNERAVMSLGFIPSEGYKAVNKNWGTTYVRFVGFDRFPIIRPVPNPNNTYTIKEIETKQTATTLCDYAVSDALNKFMESMRVKKPMSNGSWGLIGMAAIIVVALIGGYLYMTGRA